jgi:hypothetical protein
MQTLRRLRRRWRSHRTKTDTVLHIFIWEIRYTDMPPGQIKSSWMRPGDSLSVTDTIGPLMTIHYRRYDFDGAHLDVEGVRGVTNPDFSLPPIHPDDHIELLDAGGHVMFVGIETA